MTRTAASLRAAVVALLTGTLAALAPAASAAPMLHGSPVLATAPGSSSGTDDATSADRPVTVRVTRFEPRTVTPGSTITVSGTLTNTGSRRITGLAARLQRGEVRTTRDELDAAVAEADPATTVLPAFRGLPGTLAPGAQLPFTYILPSDQLQMAADGVYPVLFNVNGTVDGSEHRVGELATFLVRQTGTDSRTAVAWLWPITERTHRGPTGGFLDDDLRTSISSNGRLDRMLSTLERLPGIQSPSGTKSVPALQVTLAIDPALVEELTVMAAGPYAVPGLAGGGHGTEAARAFLARLRTVAALHPVVALPYGDVDADALVGSGMSDVLTRTLPGTAAGTAQDPPHGGAAQPSPSSTTPTSSSSSGATPGPRETPSKATGAGERILTAALHITPRTDLAWPAGGTARTATLATLQAGGIRSVVLSSAGLSGGDRAIGVSGSRTTPHATVTTSAGRLDVLVADPVLGGIVGSAETTAGGPRMAEQRYLAELAVLALQAPAHSTQTVLVAPPRTVLAGPDGAGAMMADTVGLPWLRPGSVGAVDAGPSASAGTLVAPPTSGGLDGAGMAFVVGAVAVREDLAGAVVGKAATALQTEDAAIARTVSYSWRGAPGPFRIAARNLATSIGSLRSKVTLLAPADGTYSLASSDAPLVLTVRNDLPFSVSVRLDVHTRGNRGLSITDIGAQTLASGQRTTLQVPTKLQQSGGFAVIASLTTPTGGPLGQRVEMQVKSTIYGPVSLLITFGAAGLLGLLFLRRLVLFVLRRRRAAVAVPATPADVQPPTRSPV